MTRQRLLAGGLTDEQIVLCNLRPQPRLTAADLEPSSYAPEFASLVQRLQRALRGGRGLSVYVTGRRADPWARQHVALQIGIGLTQLGRRVVIADADFLRPGLGGLVADPATEGVIDMVRFGRSVDTLLLRPVGSGPFLLPAGSFPVEDPMPLGPEALRSVVYRVSQACELALYVGPLAIRNESNPLAHVCDHVVYAASDEDAETEREILEHVGELRRLNVSLQGAVLYGMEAAPEPEAARGVEPWAGTPTGPLPAFEPGSLYPSGGGGADVEPLFLPAGDAGGPLPPEPHYEPLETAAPAPLPGAPEPPGPEMPAAEWDLPLEMAPDADSEPGLEPVYDAGVPGRIEEEDAETEGEFAAEEATRAVPRSAEEARRVDEDLAVAEFAFDEERRYSRLPLYLLGTLVVLIATFLVWVLWTKRGVEEHLAPSLQPRSEAPAPVSGGGVPPAPGALPVSGDEVKPEHPAGSEKTTGAGQVPASPAPRAEVREPPPAARQEPGLVTSPGGAAPVPQAGGTQPRAGEGGVRPPSPDDREAAERQAGAAGSPVGAPPAAPSVPGAAGGGPPPPVTTKTPGTEPGAAPSTSAGAPSVSAGGRLVYTVHVGSYRTSDQAMKDIATLQKNGFFDGRVVRTDLGSMGVWFRVCVGSYPTGAAADSLRGAIIKLPEFAKFAMVLKLRRE